MPSVRTWDCHVHGRLVRVVPCCNQAEWVRQRQDSLDDQLRDVRRMATQMGCYDAADWIRARTLYETPAMREQR